MDRTASLVGRVAVVTGGGRGIGRAIALALSRSGAAVAVGDIDPPDDLTLPGRSLVGRLDVTDRASYAAFLAGAESALGPLDVLVSNAGVLRAGPLVDEPDDWTRRTLEVNVLGPLLGMKLTVPGMVARGRGHVVTIASIAGRAGVPGIATYSASKHAVLGASDALREELRGTGVRISTVLPSLVRTELASGARDAGIRTVTPEEVAAAVLHVLSTGAAQVTVPRSAAPLLTLGGALPPRLRAAVARALGGSDAYQGIPPEQRAAYEARTAQQQPR